MRGSNFLEPRNSGDVHVRLGIRFLSLIEYSNLFGAHDLYGTHSTWSCLFLLGPSSSETTTLKTSHAAPRIGLETPRLPGGELLRWVSWLQLELVWTQAIPDVTSSLRRSISVFFVPPWRSVAVSSSSKASVPLFLVLPFLLFHGRASPLRQKGLLAVDVLFYFGEHLGHARLWVLRNGERHIFRLYAEPDYKGGDGKFLI